jgi:serine protease Do
MENFNKQQFITGIVLVALATSLITGVVTASLVSQNPLGKVISQLTDQFNPASQRVDAQINANGSSDEDLIITAVERVSPAVVSIIATKDLPVINRSYGDGDSFFRQFFPQLFPQATPVPSQRDTQPRQVGSGSGFIVTANGHVLTNRHVVEDEDASYTVVMNDGSKHAAKVLALDTVHDVAILKIDGSNFSTVTLGDSNSIKIGQTAIAIGNALGEFQNTVSVGVISGLQRNITAGGPGTESEELRKVIQTDAAINPGNSGGPLLNKHGEVIGMNTAMAGGAENIGFALPINIAKKGLDSVISTGKISYPFLGIQYTIVTSEVKEERNLSVDYGALLIEGQNGSSAVVKNSPAEKAGLKSGDIILEFNGTRITKDRPLAELVEEHKVGDTVRLKVLRDGKQFDTNAILSERTV